MSDLREKEPESRRFDFADKMTGRAAWEIDVDVWPYSGIKSEKVYPKKATFVVRAEDVRQATGLAVMIAGVIKGAHDVWETRVTRVEMATS